MLRIESAAPPLDRPALGARAAALLARAEIMGLLPSDRPITRLDRSVLLRTADTLLRRAGVGRNAILELRAAREPAALGAALDRLLVALEDSPAPESEWRTLVPLLGPDLLARLLGISGSSLRRYASRARPTPDEVAARLHLIALVVADLAGGYNDYGIRRWFERERSTLGGRSPAATLRGGWDPQAEGPRRVRELARSIAASPAT